MAKQPSENKDAPNVSMLKMQQELEETAKEVLAMEGKGFFAKLGLGRKTREVTPAIGTDILEIAFLRGDKEINKLVSQHKILVFLLRKFFRNNEYHGCLSYENC